MEEIEHVYENEEIVECQEVHEGSTSKTERESVPTVIFGSTDVEKAFEESGIEGVRNTFPGCGVSKGRGDLMQFYWNPSSTTGLNVIEKNNYIVLNKENGEVVCVGPKRGYLFGADRVREVATQITKEWENIGSDPRNQLTAQFIPCGHRLQLLWRDSCWEVIERGNCYANRIWERQINRILGYRGLSLSDFDKQCIYTLVLCLKGPNSTDSLHVLSIKTPKGHVHNKVAIPEIETDRISSMLSANSWGRIKGYIQSKLNTAYSYYMPIGEISIRYGNRYWTVLTDAGTVFNEYQAELATKNRITRFDEFAEVTAARFPYAQFFIDTQQHSKE